MTSRRATGSRTIDDPIGAHFDEEADARVREYSNDRVRHRGRVFLHIRRDGNNFFNTFENCRYCDFDRLCPRDRGAQWEAKQDDPVTQSFVALRGPVRDSESDQ